MLSNLRFIFYILDLLIIPLNLILFLYPFFELYCTRQLTLWITQAFFEQIQHQHLIILQCLWYIYDISTLLISLYLLFLNFQAYYILFYFVVKRKLVYLTHFISFCVLILIFSFIPKHNH